MGLASEMAAERQREIDACDHVWESALVELGEPMKGMYTFRGVQCTKCAALINQGKMQMMANAITRFGLEGEDGEKHSISIFLPLRIRT